MKTSFSALMRVSSSENVILAVLGIATVPLLLLPGCSLADNYDVSMSSPAARVRHAAIEASPRTVAANAPCPAINFQTTQALAGSNSEPYFGLQRQADGSFSEETYTADTTAQTITKTGSTANIQQSLINCAGLAARTRRVVAPALRTNPLGTPARNPIWVDLAGDGVGAIVGFTDFFDSTQVLVQRANLDGTPKGSFGAYTVGIGAVGLVAGDFNGDGKPDVAVVYTGSSPSASGPGGVSILLGNGDGTLKPAVNYATSANAWSMTAFDWNGDGKPDLAVGDYSGGLQILLANADGTLHSGAKYSMNASEGPVESLAAADLNGDRIPDLLVLTDTTLHLLYGKGDGTFATGPTFPSGGTFGSLGTGDFNLDGITDFAIESPIGAVFVYLGTGSGNFSAPTAYSTLYASYGAGVGEFFVEDFDGDGYPDLVFGAGHPDALTPLHDGSNISVLFGNGDGTFASGAVLVVDSDTSYQATPAPTALAVADFNGDGKPDVATSNTHAKSVSVALGNGKGAFQAPSTISMGTVQPTSIAAAAFSGDGKPDIVVTDGVSNIYLLYHNGNGTFQQPIRYPTGGTNPSFVVTGDFNGDKKLDVAVVNSGSNNISILTGFGDGSFGNPIIAAVGTNPVGLVAGDFNGDGKLDLAVANGGSSSASTAGGISVLLGKGDGTFQAAVNYAASQYPVFITAADLNHDGKVDLAVAANTGSGPAAIAVLLGTGSGTFQNAVMTATSAGPTWIAAADFSGDGKLDLAVAHCCHAAGLSTLQGNGDGTFQAESTLGDGSNSSTAAADFDGDGKPDLAFVNYYGGYGRTVTVYRNISVSLGTLTIVNAAGNPFKAPPVAPYSIATALGTDLATSPVANSAATLPVTLAGTTVSVQDSAGMSRPSQLYYVSSGQVNFIIPQGTAIGNATVTITSGDGHISVGTLPVTAVAPGIFTLNTNSLAAAYVQRVHADGTQSIENLYAVDSAGNLSYPPIDLGPATDQVYLSIFGTGIQGRSSLNSVAITVGGVSVTPLYAGPASYPAEDQVAILLPRSLVGAGTVNLTLSADGNAANVTTLNIK
jgi:uncharacterized protein (TIGR03437 family)